MNSIGTMLKQAREERGYTQSQIADSTRILVQIIKGLEEEDFSGIVAPIYGRGFVKLYAEAVGLDPKECIDAFMQAYNRKPEKIDAPPENVVEANSRSEEDTLFKGAFAQELGTVGTPPAPPQFDSASTFSSPQQKSASFSSRYVAPITRHLPTKKITVPSYVWRLFIVLGVAILIIYFLVTSVKALYRATCTKAPLDEQAEVSVNNEPITPAVDKPERKVEKLPDFYID